MGKRNLIETNEMMKLFILVILLTASRLVCAQHNVKPVIGFNYSAVNTAFPAEEYSVNVGMSYLDQLYLSFNVSMFKNKMSNDHDPQYEKMKIITGSLSASYRFLKPKHRFSPLLYLGVGYGLSSNYKGKYITDNYKMVESDSYNAWRIFDRMGLNPKSKLMLDVRIDNFNIRLGGSLNHYLFKLINPISWFSNPSESHTDFGFGIEAGLIYTFWGKENVNK